MRNWRVTFTAAALAVAQAEAQPPVQLGGLMNEYLPALCRPGPFGNSSFQLVVFPPGSTEVVLEVPIKLWVFAYAPSGTALYEWLKGESRSCLYKVEFNPVHIAPAACPPGLDVVFSFAISSKEDRILISGAMKGESGLRCGVFEVHVADGTTSEILGTTDCGSYRDRMRWASLSPSPSMDRAVAISGNQLELIDVDKGTIRAIGDGFVKASWSPDGKWVAALKKRGGTVLLDASYLKKVRALAESEVEWSPDSRYLLRSRECFSPIASNGVGTLEALDVNTGKRIAIESSHCKVDFAGLGWVRRSIVPQVSEAAVLGAKRDSLRSHTQK
jgi:hypothetical protein